MFRKQLVLFKKIVDPIERKKIRLTMFPYWVKVGPCPPKCDRKDLAHAIGSTFGGLINKESKGVFSRIWVWLDVLKSLCRGIFVLIESNQKCWVPFKYENLPGYYFSCGKLGHYVKNCCDVSNSVKNLTKDDYPFSIVLKVELNFIGKVSLLLGSLMEKTVTNCSYLGDTDALKLYLDSGGGGGMLSRKSGGMSF